MASPIRMNRGAWVLLGVLVLVMLWTHQMTLRTAQLKAKAAADRAAQSAGQTPGIPGAAASSFTSAPALPAGLAQARALQTLKLSPWGDDPFWKSSPMSPRAEARPARRAGPGPSATAPGALVLRGIIWSSSSPCAQIGGEIASRGDKVYGWTVKDIQQSSVTLQHDGATVTLHLHEDGP